MMRAVSCPHHGDEALEHLRGRLDDDAALAAEEHLATCSHCASWYADACSDEAFAAVDRVVGRALREVGLPRQQQRRWLAVAAALTLVVAGYGWWQHSHTSAPQPLQDHATIASFDFESGAAGLDRTEVLVADPPDTAAARPSDAGSDTLFTSDLEDGGLGSWEIHT
jgi:anti-sigma factor RsiW